MITNFSFSFSTDKWRSFDKNLVIWKIGQASKSFVSETNWSYNFDYDLERNKTVAAEKSVLLGQSWPKLSKILRSTEHENLDVSFAP